MLLNVIFSYRRPAKYLDPVTNTPYYGVQAFKILREAYFQHLKLNGDKNNENVKKWLEWKESLIKEKTNWK